MGLLNKDVDDGLTLMRLIGNTRLDLLGVEPQHLATAI